MIKKMINNLGRCSTLQGQVQWTNGRVEVNLVDIGTMCCQHLNHLEVLFKDGKLQSSHSVCFRLANIIFQNKRDITIKLLAEVEHTAFFDSLEDHLSHICSVVHNGHLKGVETGQLVQVSRICQEPVLLLSRAALLFAFSGAAH